MLQDYLLENLGQTDWSMLDTAAEFRDSFTHSQGLQKHGRFDFSVVDFLPFQILTKMHSII